MPHEMLNRFDAHAALMKNSRKRASATVTARLNARAFVDRFEPGAQRHVTEVTTCPSAPNERLAIV